MTAFSRARSRIEDVTLDGTLRLAAQRICAAGQTDSHRLDAETLLCHTLGRSRAWILGNPEALMPAEHRTRFAGLVDRRCKGVPVAYLTGRKEFWSMMLNVDESVLIPRPETELIVDLGVAFIGKRQCRVLDMGTGSGAIGLAIACECRQCEVVATDVSAAAIAVASGNQRLFPHCEIRFLCGSWFEPVIGERFDLIVSNPPYVDHDDPHLRDSIRYEPRSALVADCHGLSDLQTITSGAPDFLTAGGGLIVEHGYQQGVAVRKLFEVAGLEGITTHSDIAGLERVTAGRMPLAG